MWQHLRKKQEPWVPSILQSTFHILSLCQKKTKLVDIAKQIKMKLEIFRKHRICSIVNGMVKEASIIEIFPISDLALLWLEWLTHFSKYLKWYSKFDIFLWSSVVKITFYLYLYQSWV